MWSQKAELTATKINWEGWWPAHELHFVRHIFGSAGPSNIEAPLRVIVLHQRKSHVNGRNGSIKTSVVGSSEPVAGSQDHKKTTGSWVVIKQAVQSQQQGLLQGLESLIKVLSLAF